MEFLQQIKRDVGPMLFQSLWNHAQIIVEANRIDLMPHAPKRRDDVILGPPRLDLLVAKSFGRFGGDQILVNQNQYAKFSFILGAHTAIR